MSTRHTHIYILSLALLLALFGFARALEILPTERHRVPPPRAGQKITQYYESATSSVLLDVPSSTTHTFDGNLSFQAACLKIKDNDGVGYTYLTANNGTATFSTNSCE